MISIKDKHRNILQDIFAKSLASISVEVLAYGSRVSGDSYPGSDLDLVIKLKSNQALDIEILMQIKEDISNSNIPYFVDLFDWQRIPEEFRQNINKQNAILYSNL